MKRYLSLLLFFTTYTLQAQYLGGRADGDSTGRIRSVLLTGTAATASWYLGGSGDGDIKASMSSYSLAGNLSPTIWFRGGTGRGDSVGRSRSTILQGTITPAVWFMGARGRGDSVGRSRSIILQGTITPAVWFYGGIGDGDFRSVRLDSSYLGDIEWVGSISTNWNNPANWRQNALPKNGRVKISAVAQRNLFLDQNRSINSLEFSAAGVKMVLNQFQLRISGAITGANSSNFIQTNGVGKIIKNILNNDSFVFPIGNGTYNPVTITNRTGSADTFAVRVQDSVLKYATFGPSVVLPRVNKTWFVEKVNVNPGEGVNLKFQWDTSLQIGGINTYRLNEYKNNAWIYADSFGGSQSVSGTNPKVLSFTGYKGSFSPFAIGPSSFPLPLVWLGISARRVQQVPEVTWLVGAEHQVSHYEIFGSSDGVAFNSLGTVKSLGDYPGQRMYRFNDWAQQGLIEKRFYRVRQYDFSGAASESDICVLQGSQDQITSAYTLFPNPSQGKFTLSRMGAGADGLCQVRVMDLNGKEIYSTTTTEAIYTMDLSALAPGVYLLKLDQENGRSEQQRIIIVR